MQQRPGVHFSINLAATQKQLRVCLCSYKHMCAMRKHEYTCDCMGVSICTCVCMCLCIYAHECEYMQTVPPGQLLSLGPWVQDPTIQELVYSVLCMLLNLYALSLMFTTASPILSIKNSSWLWKTPFLVALLSFVSLASTRSETISLYSK